MSLAISCLNELVLRPWLLGSAHVITYTKLIIALIHTLVNVDNRHLGLCLVKRVLNLSFNPEIIVMCTNHVQKITTLDTVYTLPGPKIRDLLSCHSK